MSTTPDKAMKVLLELGDPAARRTRTQLVKAALHAATTLMDADAVALTTPWSRRGERLVLHAGSATPARVEPADGGSPIVRAMAESCEPHTVGDLSEDARYADSEACPGVEAGPVLFVPLRLQNHATAYLAVYRRRGRARFTLNDTRVMVLLGIWLGVALDHLRIASGARRLAVTDDATQVYNQGYLQTALQREVGRARRHRQPLSVLAIDVTLGEPAAGDPREGEDPPPLSLRTVGLLLAEQVRSFDVLGRRGEGFMLILPQTRRDAAADVGQRIVDVLARHGSETFGAEPHVTIGLATFPEDASAPDELVSCAERARTPGVPGRRITPIRKVA